MTRRVLGAVVVLGLSASMAAAQQPDTLPRDTRQGVGAGRGMAMVMLADSLNQRLDSLVARMNRVTGNKKVDAMAAVINELVAQRKMMMSRMHQQMMMGGGAMNMMGDSAPPAPRPAVKADSAVDTTGHAAHHPR